MGVALCRAPCSRELVFEVGTLQKNAWLKQPKEAVSVSPFAKYSCSNTYMS